MIQRLAILVLGFTLVLGVAACGGDDNGNGEATDTETTEETTTGAEGDAAAGRAIFIANCGSCHTLSDAGTSGAVGPELDGIGLSAEAIETQVRNGGGVMPPFEGTLSEQEISDVVAYVAEASSG